MKKRNIHIIALTLLTTALLGLGAMPALAETFPPYGTTNSGLDSILADAALQGAASPHAFSLTVMPYPNAPSDPEVGDGYYVGLTIGYINDVTTQQSSDAFYMFCVDFNGHLESVPVTYNVVIDSLVGADSAVPDSNLGETLQQLQTQALLGANFGTSPSGNVPFDADVQYTIWNINNPAPSPALPGPDATMGALLAAAQLTQGLHTTDFTNYFVFDTTGPNEQAFMPVPSGNPNNNVQPPVPEPGTWAMLGLSLIGLGSLKLRRNRR